jgi:hypothetical protein
MHPLRGTVSVFEAFALVAAGAGIIAAIGYGFDLILGALFGE